MDLKVMDRERALDAYERAWSESDERKVRAWIQECWTPSSTYVNPLTDMVHGVDGLARLILDYRDIFPDVDIRLCGPPDTVEQHARYPWRLSSTARIRMLGKDYGHVMDGLDIIEFDEDGKIKTVVSFFGSTAG
jgi:hypothetical protein